MSRRYLCNFFVVAIAAMLMSVGVLGCSNSAKYPAKSIDYVVPLPPGGGTDVGARVIGKALSKELGVPVNIVNKPGGNQIPGTASTLTARADGYTLLADSASFGSLHTLAQNVPYKLEDRTFVARIMSAPHAFFVNGQSPWNSLEEVIAAAKKDPGSFSYTWLGGSTTTDFSMLQFFSAAGIDISKLKRIPYQGAGKAVEAVAGNHVAFGAGGASAVFSLAKSGDLKVLAVTGSKRLPQLAQVPTTAELGLSSVDLTFWVGISGPKSLPKEVVEKLSAAAKKVADDPEVAKEFEAIGAYPDYMGPDQLCDYEFKEAAMFKNLSEKTGGL